MIRWFYKEYTLLKRFAVVRMSQYLFYRHQAAVANHHVAQSN